MVFPYRTACPICAFRYDCRRYNPPWCKDDPPTPTPGPFLLHHFCATLVSSNVLLVRNQFSKSRERITRGQLTHWLLLAYQRQPRPFCLLFTVAAPGQCQWDTVRRCPGPTAAPTLSPATPAPTPGPSAAPTISPATPAPTASPTSSPTPSSHRGAITCGAVVEDNTNLPGVHALGGVSVEHTWSFNVSDRGEAVNFDACGSDFDTWLRIYNADGAEVASCDDCGGCGVQTNLTATGLRPDGNPYTLLVEGYSRSAGRYKAAACLCQAFCLIAMARSSRG